MISSKLNAHDETERVELTNMGNDNNLDTIFTFERDNARYTFSQDF